MARQPRALKECDLVNNSRPQLTIDLFGRADQFTSNISMINFKSSLSLISLQLRNSQLFVPISCDSRVEQKKSSILYLTSQAASVLRPQTS